MRSELIKATREETSDDRSGHPSRRSDEKVLSPPVERDGTSVPPADEQLDFESSRTGHFVDAQDWEQADQERYFRSLFDYSQSPTADPDLQRRICYLFASFNEGLDSGAQYRCYLEYHRTCSQQLAQWYMENDQVEKGQELFNKMVGSLPRLDLANYENMARLALKQQQWKVAVYVLFVPEVVFDQDAQAARDLFMEGLKHGWTSEQVKEELHNMVNRLRFAGSPHYLRFTVRAFTEEFEFSIPATEDFNARQCEASQLLYEAKLQVLNSILCNQLVATYQLRLSSLMEQ